MATRRILVVGCEGDAASLERMLEERGYAVTGVAGSVDDVRATAESVQPDLALVAADQPGGIDGIELSEVIRDVISAPVVYVVEGWPEERWARALRGEPAGYVVQPVEPWDLVATIELALRHHGIETRRRIEGEQYRLLFQQNVAGVYRKSGEGILLQCNASFARMFGFESPAELEGRSMEILYASLSDRTDFLESLRAQGSVANYELPMRRADGAPIWVLENATLSRDPETHAPVVVGTLIDITDRKTVETRLERQANQDPLTGLANRRALEARAQHALELARRRDETGALLFLDLIRFKEINDTLGHRAGDLVLVETARRLEARLRASDTAARVGGDEFVVLLSDVDGREGARAAGLRILDRFRPPMDIDGVLVDVRVRMGIALFPDHAGDLARLMALAGRIVSDRKAWTESNLVVYEPA